MRPPPGSPRRARAPTGHSPSRGGRSRARESRGKVREAPAWRRRPVSSPRSPLLQGPTAEEKGRADGEQRELAADVSSQHSEEESDSGHEEPQKLQRPAGGVHFTDPP